ncbi:MAG TPA: efflux RND transporter periplasmic adaptor subunit [Dehalococcoidia bacterium]|nr:efflux RND transporter periplasmic adaptor subunit [Dehalococcoidia bacterium]
MTRKTWLLAAAGVVAGAAVIGGVVVMTGAKAATPSTQEPPVNTAKVVKGRLSAMVFQYGTLTYRAQPDGSPYSVTNQAHGIYTELPEGGDEIGCGDVLYRVNDSPVLLLCGDVPAYRDLHSGDTGNDVRQLNQNLHALGDDSAAGVAIDPDDNAFAPNTQQALEARQRDKGANVTGELDVGNAVFLPEAVRIAGVSAELGGSAQSGAQVLSATSDTPEVQLDLDPSQQGEVKPGDAALIILPGNKTVTGKVDRLGKVAQIPAGLNKTAADAIIPAFVSLDAPGEARGLDKAPVQVQITTDGVDNALSVPVTALVGKTGGGFAVEIVRNGGQHELVAVKLGLYDTAGGRVQVDGDIHEGDLVVVPSS